MWVRKKLYTELCDFFDDGKCLTYTLGTARNMGYGLQVGLCKAPPRDRVHAQHNWEEGLPFCGGWYFRGERELLVCEVRKTLRLDGRRNAPYTHHRRRGWTLHDAESFPAYHGATPSPLTHILSKPGPTKTATLRFVVERSSPFASKQTRRYELLRDDASNEPLENVTWADRSTEGHLLTATHAGVLRASIFKNTRPRRVLHEQHLSTLRPPSNSPLGPSTSQTAERR